MLEITCHETLYAPTPNHLWVAYRGDEPQQGFIHGYGATRTAAIISLFAEEEQYDFQPPTD